jgi:(E)-4-hydroxy-3-methylbut-2-enyl-diphosphate synthase
MFIKRHVTHAVKVRNITMGGGNPVIIQSMTNTDTADIKATTKQIIELVEAGSELVRITINNEQAAKAVPFIREKLDNLGYDVPLAGCFHYNGHSLLSKFPEMAQAIDKYRINPGNIGFGKKHDANFAQIIELAQKYNKAIRIGVNWGSLDQGVAQKLMDDNLNAANPKSNQQIIHEALIYSAINSAKQAEDYGMRPDQLVISCKVSRLPQLVEIYQELAAKTNYALHLGLTEAGMGMKGIAATSGALSILLAQGIGDTIRSSITPQPGGDRRDEVRLCQEILQNLSLRNFNPEISACPGCGRTTSTVFQNLASEIQQFLDQQISAWRKEYPKIVNLKIAVMGCIVNGPGESKHSNIGISLPGTGEQPAAPVFIDGIKKYTLRGDDIADQFKKIVTEYVKVNYIENN